MLIANPPPATEFNFKTNLLITVFLVILYKDGFANVCIKFLPYFPLSLI